MGTSPLPLFAVMLAEAEAAELAVWESIDAMRLAHTLWMLAHMLDSG